MSWIRSVRITCMRGSGGGSLDGFGGSGSFVTSIRSVKPGPTKLLRERSFEFWALTASRVADGSSLSGSNSGRHSIVS
jgi:hypothetical protein